MNNSKQVVIGAATGYQYHQVDPFINSLLKTGYSGDVVLIVYEDNAELMSKLKAKGIKLLTIKNFDNHKLKSLFKLRFNPRLQFIFWFIIHLINLTFFFNSKLRIFNLGRISSFNLSIACSRYYYYYKILSSTKYEHIMVSDVKDVVFQTNPFDNVEKGIYFAIESKDVKIKEQKGNDKWVKRLFNEHEYTYLKEQNISCSGTTLGTREHMLDYFQLMIHILATNSNKIAGRFGYDQGAHNYIVWRKKVKDYHLVQNLAGFILTMVTTEESEFIVNNEGMLTNKDGSIVSIIHQYNWFPNVKFKAIEI